jgi:hypothetical protein
VIKLINGEETSLATQLDGSGEVPKSMEGGWPPLVLASVIQMPYAHNQCVSPPKKMMVRQFYNHDGSEALRSASMSTSLTS